MWGCSKLIENANDVNKNCLWEMDPNREMTGFDLGVRKQEIVDRESNSTLIWIQNGLKMTWCDR